MNDEDQFEQRLQRQALRPVPVAWREEILSAARAAASRPEPMTRAPSGSPAFAGWMWNLLWPNPRAWAALAGAWLAIGGVNVALREPSLQVLTADSTPASSEERDLLRQQEQMLAELVGPMGKREAERPRSAAPQPRSQSRDGFRNA